MGNARAKSELKQFSVFVIKTGKNIGQTKFLEINMLFSFYWELTTKSKKTFHVQYNLIFPEVFRNKQNCFPRIRSAKSQVSEWKPDIGSAPLKIFPLISFNIYTGKMIKQQWRTVLSKNLVYCRTFVPFFCRKRPTILRSRIQMWETDCVYSKVASWSYFPIYPKFNFNMFGHSLKTHSRGCSIIMHDNNSVAISVSFFFARNCFWAERSTVVL